MNNGEFWLFIIIIILIMIPPRFDLAIILKDIRQKTFNKDDYSVRNILNKRNIRIDLLWIGFSLILFSLFLLLYYMFYEK